IPHQKSCEGRNCSFGQTSGGKRSCLHLRDVWSPVAGKYPRVRERPRARRNPQPGIRIGVSVRDLNSRIANGHEDNHGFTLEEVERNHILATLKQTQWVVSGPRGAASRLGLNRSTLHFRMKKLGISRSLEAGLNQSKYCEAAASFEGD